MIIRRARSHFLAHAPVLVAVVQRSLLVCAVLERGAADRAFAPFVRLDDVGELFLRGARGFLSLWGAVLRPDVGVAVAVFGGCWCCGGGGVRGGWWGNAVGGGGGSELEWRFAEEEFADLGVEAVERVFVGGGGGVPEPAHCWFAWRGSGGGRGG